MARRKTEALVRVALAMLREPFGRHYGYGLMDAAHVLSGTLYPILDRMLDDDWVTAQWDLDESTGKPRRIYELTDRGRQELGAVVAHAKADRRFASLFGGPVVS